ncbi:MAG TPA: pyrroloquinoline quinone-dependent dehydrogenase [Rhizomicrobium sp.]|nr:pyrroloquinoline quinone-dependent dehydrogenase [Rhizomicrobium sp.]
MKRALHAAAAGWMALAGPAEGDTGWSQYGGDPGGQRFSTATQITPANVTGLRQAWSYSTGAMARHAGAMSQASFEDTPILDEGKLFVCSPFYEAIALDPGTGKELWRFDPHIDTSPHIGYPEGFKCRGLAYGKDAAGRGRIYLATADRRLIALDAASGRPVEGFGAHGAVTVSSGKLEGPGQMQFTSMPLVSHGVVIIGSTFGDNRRAVELPGTVHAFDATTGAPRWSFDPLAGANEKAGAANVWAPMSLDEKRGLVFLPTTSPSPDFWGGYRTATEKYTTAVVALKVESGEVVWSFQTVHHNVWDYDLPAQPTLGRVTYRGKTVDAVLQPTKQGLLFTLDRETGRPLIPVEERKVPQGGAPGEHLSPTQPFPLAPAPLAPSHITPDDAWGLTFWDRGKCRDAIASARNEGLFTPVSLRGSIIYPSNAGGTNWGGLSFDPARNIVYVNTSNIVNLVKLIPSADLQAARKADPHAEFGRNTGAPYAISRKFLLSPFGMPCNAPPWGALHAIDMHDGHELWKVPLGTTEDLAPFSQYLLGTAGAPNLGGPVATAGGLVFIAAAMDDYLRAFDAKSGAELWKGRLPAGGQATPMTYMWRGKQYVVIAAGGHAKLNTKRGDQVVAFALPD